MKEIDGLLYRKLLENGLNNLAHQESYINSLNVFPVPDGDTGTNMRLTLESGLENSHSEEKIGSFFKDLSKGMLFGARGNSGVILSQIFKGLAKSLVDLEKATIKDLINAHKQAYEIAYKAVINPVDGTILTVCHDETNNLKEDYDDILDLFLDILDNMKKSVDNTPNLLEVLKTANVVDSGGLGLYTIYEGMCFYLQGKIIDPVSNKQSIRQFSYNRKKQDYVNLHLQKDITEHKKNAFIAVANGDGFVDFFQNFGCDIVIETKNSQEASSLEFIKALNTIDAENIVILTNNKNNYLSAMQAVKELKFEHKTTIINTKSMVEGYFSLQTADLANKNQEMEDIVSSIEELLSNLEVIKIAKANRNIKENGIEVIEGKYIAISKGHIITCNQQILDTTIDSINQIENLDEKESIVIFKGKNIQSELFDEIIDEIMEKFDDLSTYILEGNQDVFDLLIGII